MFEVNKTKEIILGSDLVQGSMRRWLDAVAVNNLSLSLMYCAEVKWHLIVREKKCAVI